MPTFIVLKNGVVVSNVCSSLKFWTWFKSLQLFVKADTLIGGDATKVETLFKKYDKECEA